MRSKLEAHKNYENMRGYYGVLLLMASIKGINFKFNGHKHPLHALYNTECNFYRYYQTRQTTNTQYLETFKNKVLVI